MKINNDFSLWEDLVFPIIAFVASLPFLIIFGAIRGVGDSCDIMAASHAKDYIKDRW